MLKQQLVDEKLKKEQKKENTVIFEFDGGAGDYLTVYDDRVIIKHKGLLNALAVGVKGDKTIYLSDVTAIQYKKPGFTAGYLQFSILGGKENIGGVFGATQDENTITISGANRSAEAEKTAQYLNNRLAEIQNMPRGGMANAISPADEVKKLKGLPDDRIIAQKEFDKKKKELLGL